MRRRVVATTAVGLLASAALGMAPAAAASAPGVQRLSGVLRLDRGTCANGNPAGSYLSVTFGTHAIGNPASSCAHGTVTLLTPGDRGLSTVSYSPPADIGFDANGDAVATSITRPTAFGSHRLSLVSSAQDLQDAPGGPATFALPHIYVTGSHAMADVRSVQALYDRGCWLIGTQRATGTYDDTTGRLTLSWFTGQSFVRQSAGTAVHLSGIFEGAPKSVPKGHAVKLGTASFAAGAPAPPRVVSNGGREKAAAGIASVEQPAQVAYGARTTPLTQIVRSPITLVAAAVLVGIDALLFAAAIGRRRT